MRKPSILLTALSTVLLLVVASPVGAAPPDVESTELLQSAYPITGADGMVDLTRHPNGTFTWKLEATGLEPGHSYTIWVGNFDGGDGRSVLNDGGHGAGGIVGGSGTITAAGNHCVRPLDGADELGETGGFVPGSAPDCGFVDPSGQIIFFLIDHGPWDEGDQDGRWSPLGGGFEGFMSAFFPAP